MRVMAESGEGAQRLMARDYRRLFIDPEVKAEMEAEMDAGVGGGASIDVPGMRDSSLTRGRKRNPDRLLPFRFSSWITGESDEMTLSAKFGEVYWRNCPSPAKIRFRKTGAVYSVFVGIDLAGRCIMAQGFRDFIRSIEAAVGDRLDFTYNGKGKFEVSIGDDEVKTKGEKPYNDWEEALQEVRRRLS